jgi:hypothetical protein
MPRAAAEEKPVGTVKETVIREREVPPAEEQESIEWRSYMAGLSAEQWNEHVVYIYRSSPPGQSGYIDKFAHTFDEAYLKDNFGGGEYTFWINKGSERKAQGKIKIVGEPLSNGSTGGGDSETMRAIRLLIEKTGNPGGMQTDLLKAAFLNALEIQKVNAEKPMSLVDLTTALKNLKEVSGDGGGMPEWVKQLTAALVPVGVELIKRILEPKDALTELTKLGTAMTTLQGITGGGEKSTGAAIIGQLPALGQYVVEALKQIRGAEADKNRTLLEMERQRRGTVTVLPANASPPASPGAAPGPLGEIPLEPISNPAASGAIPVQLNSWEDVMHRLVGMVKEGYAGADVIAFLNSIDPPRTPEQIQAGAPPSLTQQLAQLTLEQIKMFINHDPILREMAGFPQFNGFVQEVFEFLHDTTAQPAPAV